MRSVAVLAVLALMAGCMTPLPSEALAGDPSSRPVRFALGPDAAPGPFVDHVTLDPDAMSFRAALRVVPDATTRMDALLRLENSGTEPASVRLGADPLDGDAILGAWLLVGDARVDVRQDAPSTSLVLAPGEGVDVGVETTLGTTPAGALLPTWSVRLDVLGS